MLADGSTGFFFRTVGPMIAPGHRVLDVGTGCGVGAVVAASREAHVVACDPSAAAVAVAESNLRALDLWDRVDLRPGSAADVVGDEQFDLVLLNGPQDPAGYELTAAVLAASPRWLGERGRLLLVADRTTGMSEFVASHVPAGYRVVRLARSGSPLSGFDALSVGWDIEAARERRHSERSLGRSDARRAEVSRRRWARSDADDSANEAPPQSEIDDEAPPERAEEA